MRFMIWNDPLGTKTFRGEYSGTFYVYKRSCSFQEEHNTTLHECYTHTESVIAIISGIQCRLG